MVAPSLNTKEANTRNNLYYTFHQQSLRKTHRHQQIMSKNQFLAEHEHSIKMECKMFENKK